MAPFFMSKSLEPVWIEQEPHHVFATVQFNPAVAQFSQPLRSLDY
jgi:hypothetical protein